MINVEQARKYCCEDISLIENYKEAVTSNEKYAIHHKLGLYFDMQWLKDNGFYYEQRAEMLVFMKESEHASLHNTGKQYHLGRKLSEEHKRKIGRATLGLKRSEETKRKMSLSKIGHCVTIETRLKLSQKLLGIPNIKCSKRVAQYTKDGILVSEYLSAREAERQTGVSPALISLCCKGKRKTAGGYCWRFAE